MFRKRTPKETTADGKALEENVTEDTSLDLLMEASRVEGVPVVGFADLRKITVDCPCGKETLEGNLLADEVAEAEDLDAMRCLIQQTVRRLVAQAAEKCAYC